MDDTRTTITPPKPSPAPPVEITAKTIAEPSPILIGTTAGLLAEPVTIDPADLVTHAAFLGASGSGKTTLAPTIVEQLLMQGIPAILVDRKGDLYRYADPDA